MAVKTFACPNGHHWHDVEVCTKCPICGAEAAETIGNGDAHHATEDGSAGAGDKTTAQPPRSGFGRYKLIDELGHGGMGIVYRAFDPVHQRQIALKTLPHVDPVLLSRFKREFRVLAGVDHPNVVKLFELTSDGETWFFTMEIVAGVNLLTHVGEGVFAPLSKTSEQVDNECDLALTEVFIPREPSPEHIAQFRDAFAQLAGAIAALHASGIVHRDIKPSNVVVTADGRVVLLDFGLAAETDSSGVHQSLHQQVMGTAAYMSPEQAACDPVSSASDWYSLGVMLYQALTGRLPFAGKTVDVLFQKQHQDPLPPTEIAPSVPQDWNDLCLALLRRDPACRPGAERILELLGNPRQQNTPPQVEVSNEIALVGRESHLQLLQDAWVAVRSGQAKTVFVEGRSGNGKSALVEAFVERATLDEAVVLDGRCYEMESVPFKAIDSLVDSLVEHLKHLPSTVVDAIMPRDIHALAKLFPVLGQVEAVASLPRRQIDAVDQQELNRRAIGALRELLSRMGDRCPLVVYIDDLQWGDEDSAAMLSDLLQPPDPPVLLFLGTYRSEDADSSQFLQSFRLIQRQREVPLNSLHIEVLPLEKLDAVKLALALLQHDDASARCSAESIAAEADGNPFFVSELVKHLQLDVDRQSNTNKPLGLFDMIWSRVQRLPEESQRLLTVVALWGQSMPLNQALQIADAGQSAIAPLRTGHFIRMVGLSSSTIIETYHDRVRESVSQRLDIATKQQCHLRIAENWVQKTKLSADEIVVRLGSYLSDASAQIDEYLDVLPIWYEVAVHFDAAGRPDRAFPYALASAEKAREQCSLDVAEHQFKIAERSASSHEDKFTCRIAEELGDVMMLRGNYDGAKVRFNHALKLSTGSLTRIEAKLGELAFKQGDMEKAIEVFERVIALLAYKVPTGPLEIGLQLVKETVVQVLHSLFPKILVARKTLQDVEEQLLIIRLHNRLTYAYFFERGQFPCLWSHLRGMNLAEQYPPTRELAHAYSIHGPVMGLVAFFDRGIAYVERSQSMYTALGDQWGQGQSLNFHGIVLFAASRFDECIEKCREAVRVLERAGDLWEVNVARVHTAFCLFKIGDLAAASELAERIHFAGVDLGDTKASGYSLDVWAWSTGGRVPAEILQAELKRPREDAQVSAQVMMAEGVRLFVLDDVAGAANIFEQAQQLVEGAGVKNAYVLPLRSWLASALRRQVENTPHNESRRRTTILRNAITVARKAVRVARTFQNDLPHALRETGSIAAIKGSEYQARKYLDESLEVAKRQGAKFERAQTLYARGRVAMTFGWPQAAEDLAAGERALVELGAEFAMAYYPAPVQNELV